MPKRSSSAHSAAEQVEVDDGAGGLVAAVVDDVPLDAGGVQRDRLVGAEHQQAVAERLQRDGDLAELGPRRELDPGAAGAGQHPDQAMQSVVGVVSSQSVTVRPDQRVSTVIVPDR